MTFDIPILTVAFAASAYYLARPYVFPKRPSAATGRQVDLGKSIADSVRLFATAILIISAAMLIMKLFPGLADRYL
jgi:hypothetical protein